MHQPPEPRNPASGLVLGTVGRGRTTIAARTLQTLPPGQLIAIDPRGDLGPHLRRRSTER